MHKPFLNAIVRVRLNMSRELLFFPKGSQFTAKETKEYKPLVAELFCTVQGLRQDIMAPWSMLRNIARNEHFQVYLETSTIMALMGYRVAEDPFKFDGTHDGCRVLNLIGETFPCLTEQLVPRIKLNKNIKVAPTILRNKTPVIAAMCLTDDGKKLMKRMDSQFPDWLDNVKHMSQAIGTNTTVDKPRASKRSRSSPDPDEYPSIKDFHKEIDGQGWSWIR